MSAQLLEMWQKTMAVGDVDGFASWMLESLRPGYSLSMKARGDVVIFQAGTETIRTSIGIEGIHSLRTICTRLGVLFGVRSFASADALRTMQIQGRSERVYLAVKSGEHAPSFFLALERDARRRGLRGIVNRIRWWLQGD